MRNAQGCALELDRHLALAEHLIEDGEWRREAGRDLDARMRAVDAFQDASAPEEVGEHVARARHRRAGPPLRAPRGILNVLHRRRHVAELSSGSASSRLRAGSDGANGDREGFHGSFPRSETDVVPRTVLPARRRRNEGRRRGGRLDLEKSRNLEAVLVPVADPVDRADVLPVAQQHEGRPATEAVAWRDRVRDRREQDADLRSARETRGRAPAG